MKEEYIITKKLEKVRVLEDGTRVFSVLRKHEDFCTEHTLKQALVMSEEKLAKLKGEVYTYEDEVTRAKTVRMLLTNLMDKELIVKMFNEYPAEKVEYIDFLKENLGEKNQSKIDEMIKLFEDLSEAKMTEEERKIYDEQKKQAETLLATNYEQSKKDIYDLEDAIAWYKEGLENDFSERIDKNDIEV